MVIRPAVSADAAAVTDLIRSAFDLMPADQKMREEATVSLACGAIAQDEHLLLATVGDEVVGVCCWVPFPGNRRWVMAAGTFVDPDHQRQGIGAKLYDAALRYFTALGADTVLASVSTANTGSMKLLVEAGFEVTGLEMTRHLGDRRSDGE